MTEELSAKKTCGLCSRPVPPIPYMIYQRPEQYCSRACVDAVLACSGRRAGARGKQKEDSPMDKPAEDFGSAEVTRKFCDRQGCGRQVKLSHKGRYGEYCSNGCLKQAEKMEDQKQPASADPTPEKKEEETTKMTNPIAGGAAAATPKKKSPKGEAKAAPAKKGAAKAAAKAPKKGEAKAPAKAPKKGAAKKAPKEGGRVAQVVGLLSAKGGATAEDVMKATGWNIRSTRRFFVTLKKLGHAVAKSEDGRYKISK